MKNKLFWAIMQQVVVITYWCFRTTYQSHFQVSSIQASWPLKMGLTGCPDTSEGITTTHCTIVQKSAVLIYFVAEAWNHVKLNQFSRSIFLKTEVPEGELSYTKHHLIFS